MMVAVTYRAATVHAGRQHGDGAGVRARSGRRLLPCHCRCARRYRPADASPSPLTPTSLGQNQGLAATTVAHAGDSFGCSNSAADVEQSWLCAMGEAVGVCHVMAFVHYLAAPFISKRVSGTSYDYKHVLALLTSKTDTTVTTYSLIRPMVCLWIT